MCQKRTSFDHPVMNFKQSLDLSILNQERHMYCTCFYGNTTNTAQEIKLKRDSPSGKKLNLFFLFTETKSAINCGICSHAS